jgi:hypothetical protein
MQNGFIERFNRSYREAVLDTFVFQSLNEVREQTDRWLKEYNAARSFYLCGFGEGFRIAIQSRARNRLACAAWASALNLLKESCQGYPRCYFPGSTSSLCGPERYGPASR